MLSHLQYIHNKPSPSIWHQQQIRHLLDFDQLHFLFQIQNMRKSQLDQLVGYSRSRSPSAYHRILHEKRHRLQDSEELNLLKRSIKDAFQAESRLFHDVKQLTAQASPAQSRRINQMCIKYSISVNPRKRKTSAEDIDVDSIAKSFVNSKSKQKRNEKQKAELKKAIVLVSKRYEIDKKPQFYKLDAENLKELDKKTRTQEARKEHPYITIYQKSQAEVIAKVLKRNKMTLQTMDNCPSVNEPDEWQKDQRKMRQVYTAVKNLRSKANKYRQRFREKEEDDVQSFYIT